MRRVLILAYYFPPSVDAGSKRALGFHRHLRAHGWDPTVLTVRDGNYATASGDDWRDPDDGSVVRVPEARFPWQRGAPAGRAESSRTAPAPGRATGLATGLATRAVREALYIPDAWRGFHRPALQRARALHAERSFDAVWTTSSPWTLLRTGAALRRAGLPWVADLRDLWLDNQLGYGYSGARRALDERLERRWLGAADAVTVVTPGQRALLRARYPDRRVEVVSNGFLWTAEQVRAAAAAPRADDHAGGRFRIVFTGKVYAHVDHSAAPFLDALTRLRDDAPASFARVRCDFFGRVDDVFHAEVSARGLGDTIAFRGLVPAATAAAEQRGADALLAVVPRGRREIALTKVFDYVGALAPVLVVGPPDGACADIVRAAGAGEAFAPGDVAGITAWLRARIDGEPESAESRLARLPRVLRWSYAALAGELAGVLSSVVPPESPGTIR